MPVFPHGTLPCTTCKKVKDFVTKSVKKHYLTYSLFYILFIEMISSVLYKTVSFNSYNLFWYPFLNASGYFILFLTLFLLKDRLRFCLRKKIAVGCLTFYYLFSLSCVVFQFSEEFYINAINHTLIGVAIVTLILTFTNNKK